MEVDASDLNYTRKLEALQVSNLNIINDTINCFLKTTPIGVIRN